MNLIAAALQHGAFEIVVQDDPGCAGPVLEGAHMAAQEVLRGLVEEELRIQRPRPGQGDNEAGELTPGAAHHDGTAVGPVYLCLLSRKYLQAEEGLLGLRAQAGHGTA